MATDPAIRVIGTMDNDTPEGAPVTVVRVDRLIQEHGELREALLDCLPSLSCYCMPGVRGVRCVAESTKLCCGCAAKALLERVRGS